MSSVAEQCNNAAINLGLSGVPETMLWTLHNRASEAGKPDGMIRDPKAIEIYKSIDYDYERSFGPAENSHAIRSMIFDEAILKFWDLHPDATVVNLGEGLETQRFRLQDKEKGDVTWVSVDLPDAIQAREKFIAPDKSHVHVAASATDVDDWFDRVPANKPVFITAQGLFMYLKEEELKCLFQALAKRFPGSTLMFDHIAKWLSNKTMTGWKKTEHYTTPQMPFGANRFDAPLLFQSWVDGLEVEELPWPFDKMSGVLKYVSPIVNNIPVLRGYVPGMVFRVTFPAANSEAAHVE